MPVTNYVWDEDQYLMETDGTHTTKAVYTNKPDRYTNLISQRRGGASQFPHYDALGSTRKLTDENENITDEWAYDAWGNVISHTGTTEFPFQFLGMVGYYYDADTKNFYIIHRVFEPTSGRWLSVDPIWFGVNVAPRFFVDPLNLTTSVGSTDELSAREFWVILHRTNIDVAFYTYSENNPTNRRDPSGLKSLEELVDDALKQIEKMTQESLRQTCQLWTKKTEVFFENEWHKQLPDCPCTIQGEPPKSPDSKIWNDPKKVGEFDKKFHPCAHYCMRSKPQTIKNKILSIPPVIKIHQAGQQCCYRGGKLITGGPSAGTPDIYSPDLRLPADKTLPAGQVWLHFQEDVWPYLICQAAGMLDVYLDWRPPNVGPIHPITKESKCPQQKL